MAQGPVDLRSLIDQQRLRGYLLVAVAVALSAQMIEGYDLVSLAFAAPTVIREWGISRASLGPIFSASAVGAVLGSFLFGSLGDIRGRRSAIIAAVICSGVFSFATAWASSLSALLILRFLTGLGLGGVMPTTVALMAEYSPARIRGTMVTVMACGMSLGAAVGGVVASRIVPALGWHAVFYVGGLAPLALLPLLLAYLPESLRYLALQRGDSPRIAAILRRLDPAWRFPPDTVFALQEEGRSTGRVRQLFAPGWAAATVLLWASYFLNQICITFYNQWTPTVLNAFGLSVRDAAAAAVWFQIGGIAAAVIHGRLIDRFDFFAVLSVNYLAAAAFTVLIVAFGPAAGVILPMSFVVGFCIVGGQNAVNGLAGSFYPTLIRSTGTGWALGMGRLGSVLGPALGGMLLALHWPIGDIYRAVAAPLLCAAVTIFLMGRFAVGARAARAAAPAPPAQQVA